MATLIPESVQAGDVILIFTRGSRAQLNVAGQSLMRLRALLSGGYSRARYSHVMLGISPGVVVHSDGESVKMQRLADVLGGAPPAPGCLLALRPDHPPLDAGTALLLVGEAQYYLKQKYSFIPGRRSSAAGRLLHGRRRLTHPFCSELVAAAYAAIGRPIGRRPPDRMLPVDLEMYCQPPVWRDVTAAYLADAPAPAPDGIVIPVGGRQLTLPEFFEETDHLLHKMWGQQVEQAGLVYELVKSHIEPCVLQQQLRSAELQMSKQLALDPTLLFGAWLEITRSDVRGIDDFYAQVRRGVLREETPFADAIQAILPAVQAGRRAYESIPDVATLREFELLGASLVFGARALRLEAELTGMAAALGLPLKPDPRSHGISKAMAAPALDVLPPLSRADMEALLEHIAVLEMPEGDNYTRDVRRLCSNAVRLHAALSMLLFRDGP